MARTALYRLYDADEDLLYIGISETPEKRWVSHADTKSWWPQVAATSVEWFETRELAQAAEAKAIATERTPYNVAGSPWAPKPEGPGEGEVSTACARANLSELLNVVRLQDRTLCIVRHNTPQGGLVPPDILNLINAIGLNAARDVLVLAKTAN